MISLVRRAAKPVSSTSTSGIVLHTRDDLDLCLPRLVAYVGSRGLVPLSRHPAWLSVLADGLGHTPYCLEAFEGEKTHGFLALADVRSMLFGRFLVSLPYLNYGGMLADNADVARRLIDRAVELADTLGVRYLELRHEQPTAHAALTAKMDAKVHMRRPLPDTPEKLWKSLKDKVRNQVRRGQKSGLSVTWGREHLLEDFYDVFSRNMRDLGTPVYGRSLFRAVLRHFPSQAEFCVIRAADKPVAAALLLHGWGTTEVPSASTLREYNQVCANMLLYWHLLERAVERGQTVFDFGRCTKNSNLQRFKAQWGAQPEPAEWQYYVRSGTVGEMRPESPRYQRMIRIWQRLPVAVTRLLGPRIVRGIP
jgi:FemAB-related protein (PEP-CTERM system-associated)